MNKNYKMVFEYDNEDEVWFVKFSELPGCMTHGKTPEEALKEALEVKDEWLKIAKESGWDIKEPAGLQSD